MSLSFIVCVCVPYFSGSGQGDEGPEQAFLAKAIMCESSCSAAALACFDLRSPTVKTGLKRHVWHDAMLACVLHEATEFMCIQF